MNCMKCGREIPDGTVFCASCAAGHSVSEDRTEESAERKSILWIEQKLVQPAEQKLKKKKKIITVRRKIRVLMILLLIVLLLLGGACFFAWREHQKNLSFAAQQEDLRIREGALALREKTAAAMEERTETLENALSQARVTIQSQEAAIQDLEQQSLAAIADHDDRLHALTEENARLSAALESQNANLSGALASLTGENNHLQSRLSDAEAALKQWQETVVFFQQPGRWRYHVSDCPELDLSRTYSVFTPADAEKAGLLPCETCAAAYSQR